MSCCSVDDCSQLGAMHMQFSDLMKNYTQQQRLSAPMLWIGIYVTEASLFCTLAMAADVFQGFRNRKLWFPCKLFTLNATSLTLLAVAMKLPVDLTTSGKMDELAKLSSTTFMCTAMSNFMPSLGPMSNKELLMNVTALGILVSTMLVNVEIQTCAGAILALTLEHNLVRYHMFVLLGIMSLSALTVSPFKKILESKYDEKHKVPSNEELEQTQKFTVEELKENVKKYWMMAESGGPQFVMASFATCSASGAICFLMALILAEAEIRIYHSGGWKFIDDSGYKWSTFLIVLVQSTGVVAGNIAPAFRWFTATTFKCSKQGSNSIFKIEKYWIQRLVEWKQSPIGLQIRNRKCRKLVQDTKNLILHICIGVQIVIVVARKIVRLVPIFFISMIFLCCCSCKPLKRELWHKSRASRNHWEFEMDTGKELDLSRYVLQLEGEEELPKKVLKNISNSVNQFIQKAKKQQPKNLMELLEKSQGFNGVAKFDSVQVPPLYSDEPSNCWSLPVATLTSIAIALPNIKKEIVDRLLCSVSEGFLYTRLVEKSLNSKGDLVNIRNAADVVWLGVELYRKWLDRDLKKMALKGKTSKEYLQRMGDVAKKSVERNMNGGPEEKPLNWPVKKIAANSMYRISQTILMGYEDSNDQAYEKLFEQLSVMIADILGACLTNLPRVITMKCYCSAIEKREESVKQAARLLGETEEILKILQQHELPRLDSDQVAYIDEWRAIIKPINSQASISSSNNESTSSGFGELHIAVE